MKPILVLKALPKPWTSSFDTLADAQRALQQSGGVRVMALDDAQNVESVPGRESVGRFERMLTEGGAKSLMPGISRGKIHDRQAFEEGGLFTYRPNLQSFAPGVQTYHPDWDATFPRPVSREPDIPIGRTGKQRPQVLVGTLEKPEFHATPMEGRLQTEGFYPVGFDPEQTFLLSDPTKPFFRGEVPEAAQRIASKRTSDYAPGTYGYDTRMGRAIEAMRALPLTFEDPVSAQTGTWGKPRVVDDVFQYGEPMDIAFQLLKERVSPEAKRHKLEYDKKYESSPERVKYREELNRERRRRGIYGSHDHKDISHTQGGKLTLEGEHENRARHFKDKGTLREL